MRRLLPDSVFSTELTITIYSSDADADVLADYVLALLRHDGDENTVRQLCEAEIPDFLKEGKAIYLRKSSWKHSANISLQTALSSYRTFSTAYNTNLSFQAHHHHHRSWSQHLSYHPMAPPQCTMEEWAV